MIRKNELFGTLELNHKEIVVSTPSKMYPQETDWTCAFACIRTILSNKEAVQKSEEVYIDQYNLTPGPYYSKDIKALEVLSEVNAIYGCDVDNKTFDYILDLMEDGYGVMLESLYNYAHWMVLLGYYPLEDKGVDKSTILMYDPYFDKVRLLNTEEFISMWIDAEYSKNGIMKDFIAIK